MHTQERGNKQCEGCCYYINDKLPRLCEGQFKKIGYCTSQMRLDKTQVKFIKATKWKKPAILQGFVNRWLLWT